MKLGLEIEFAATLKAGDTIREYLRSSPSFCLGTDNTANLSPLKGYELRSKILDSLPSVELKEALTIIKLHGGRVHSTCGFHVHFSGVGIVNKYKIIDYLQQHYKYWDSRKNWCAKVSTLELVSDARYAPVRRVYDETCEDHYEIRVFNSTLSFRGICKMFNIALKAIDYSTVKAIQLSH